MSTNRRPYPDSLDENSFISKFKIEILSHKILSHKTGSLSWRPSIRDQSRQLTGETWKWILKIKELKRNTRRLRLKALKIDESEKN